MAVIAMDSTLENNLTEATCTMWACARLTLYPHLNSIASASVVYFLISVLMETLYKYRGYGHEEVKWKS